MRSLASTCCLLVLLLSWGPLSARAENPTKPVIQNARLKKIYRLYEDLDYEAALEALHRAERQQGLPRAERLWLEMMKGVLHYSLGHAAEADAAFLRLLEQDPEAQISKGPPSRTLREHFERLRRQVLEALEASKAPAEPPAVAPPSAPLVVEILVEKEAPTTAAAAPRAQEATAQAEPVPNPKPPVTTVAWGLRAGLRGERELLWTNHIPVLKTELALNFGTLPRLGFTFTPVLQPSLMLRSEVKVYPLAVQLSSSLGLLGYVFGGVTCHPADWAWAARSGVGLGLRWGHWGLSVDIGYENFRKLSAGRAPEALLLAVEIDVGFPSPPP